MTQKATEQDSLSSSSPLISVKLNPQHFIEKLRQLHAWQQQQQESLLRQQQEQLALLKRRQSASSVSPLGPLNTQPTKAEIGWRGLGAAAGKENNPAVAHDAIKGHPSRSCSSPTHTAITNISLEAPVVEVPERSPVSLRESFSSRSGSMREEPCSPAPPQTEMDTQRTPAITDDRPLRSVLGEL